MGTNFLSLVDKHFPSSNPLHKIFNRNSVKVSYSCMNNCKRVISKHNIGILSKSKTDTAPTANGNDNCNCRNTDNCPLQKNCLIESVVYKAEVEVDKESSTKEYIGMTSTTFKKRFANHKTSFENPDKRNSTELSKYIWQLKKEKRRFSIKWTILKQTLSYRSGAKYCDLCLQEKLHILKVDKTKLLNKRCELFSKCRHRSDSSRESLNARALCHHAYNSNISPTSSYGRFNRHL